MHDPSSTASYYQAIMMKQPAASEFPEQEQLKCPRCDSTNTKFCYYNNYNLSQPRHFCKSCRRYWTKGGTLRNIPVGGGSRKNTKRSGHSSSSSSSSLVNPKKTHLFKNPDPAPGPDRSSGTHDPISSSMQFGSNPVTRISGFLGPGQDPNGIYGLPVVDHHQEVKALDIGGSFSSLLASNMHLGGILNGLNGNGSGLDQGMGIRGIDGGDEWTDLSMNTGSSSFQ